MFDFKGQVVLVTGAGSPRGNQNDLAFEIKHIDNLHIKYLSEQRPAPDS